MTTKRWIALGIALLVLVGLVWWVVSYYKDGEASSLGQDLIGRIWGGAGDAQWDAAGDVDLSWSLLWEEAAYTWPRLWDFDGKYQLNQEYVQTLTAAGCKERLTEGETTLVRRYSCDQATNPEYAGAELKYAGKKGDVEVYTRSLEWTVNPEIVILHNVQTSWAILSVLQGLWPKITLDGYCEVSHVTDDPMSPNLFVVGPTADFLSTISDTSDAETYKNGGDPMYPCGLATALWQVNPTTYLYIRNQKLWGGAPGLYVDVEGVASLR